MDGIGKELRGRNILIVDDDARNTFALVSYLEDLHMQLQTAEDGYLAIDLLERCGGIDMVLMDMMMPGMDGFETIARIRNNVATAHIPIIALTAKAMKGDRAKCLEAGATEYVSKPIDMRELIGKMTEMLNMV
jgi:two-component system chemotaxis sensor kinase CheA